ncbi:MAG: enoyl-CoA hydratase-related protein [Caulobacteraceae bacterium]
MTNPIADPFVEVPDTDSQSPLVILDATVEGAATVTINRPGRGNAINAEVVAALREAFETLEGADGVRVVFVAGAGGAFSAGEDPESSCEAADHTEADNRDDAMQTAIMLEHLYGLPALTVALVEGDAFGAGAGIAAACDFAVATAEARFAFSEVELGLTAANSSPYVVAAVGPRRARGLFATGRVIDAATARDIGLIDEVAANSAALAAVKARIVAETMACAPGAVAASKRLVDRVAGREIDHGLMEEIAHGLARARAGEEGQEGVRAALQRRPPGWMA